MVVHNVIVVEDEAENIQNLKKRNSDCKLIVNIDQMVEVM